MSYKTIKDPFTQNYSRHFLIKDIIAEQNQLEFQSLEEDHSFRYSNSSKSFVRRKPSQIGQIRNSFQETSRSAINILLELEINDSKEKKEAIYNNLEDICMKNIDSSGIKEQEELIQQNKQLKEKIIMLTQQLKRYQKIIPNINPVKNLKIHQSQPNITLSKQKISEIYSSLSSLKQALVIKQGQNEKLKQMIQQYKIRLKQENSTIHHIEIQLLKQKLNKYESRIIQMTNNHAKEKQQIVQRYEEQKIKMYNEFEQARSKGQQQIDRLLATLQQKEDNSREKLNKQAYQARKSKINMITSKADKLSLQSLKKLIKRQDSPQSNVPKNINSQIRTNRSPSPELEPLKNRPSSNKIQRRQPSQTLSPRVQNSYSVTPRPYITQTQTPSSYLGRFYTFAQQIDKRMKQFQQKQQFLSPKVQNCQEKFYTFENKKLQNKQLSQYQSKLQKVFVRNQALSKQLAHFSSTMPYLDGIL